MSYKPQSDLNHNFVSADHRYGCFDKPSSAETESPMQEGWTDDERRLMRDHKTVWLPIECGHSYRQTDPACQGCKWRDHA